MGKERILKHIDNYTTIIKENPELFHDGIDEEIIDLLKIIKKYITNN